MRSPWIDTELKSYTYRRIREALDSGYSSLLPKDGDEIRGLFQEQIREFEITKLYKTEKDTPEWNQAVNGLVYSLFNDVQLCTDAILTRILKLGRSVVFVLDNTDQLGERFQEAVFLLAQYLSDKFRALSIVALREEKYFAAYRRGMFDAYGDRRFHIGSPNLGQVIEKRLNYGMKKMFQSLLDRLSTSELETITLLISAFIRSATKGNANIVRMLSCVSNGDMRYALDLFKEFLSSGNTDIDKIRDITRMVHSYTIPFHEFAKSAILGSRRFYKSSISHALNLFSKSSSRQASHFAACRIIVRLVSAQGSPSPHGEGFVETAQLLREYRESFGIADDFVLRGEELLRRGLIESEPPRAKDIQATDALRITASGAYYWSYLVRSFAYLDLVFVDTPLQDQELARELADLAESFDLTIRFERVRKFLNYLWELEGEELNQSSARGGPYQNSLVKEIQIQVEKEIIVIRRKTGALDRYLARRR